MLRGVIKPDLTEYPEPVIEDVVDLSYKDFGKIEVFTAAATANSTDETHTPSPDETVQARQPADNETPTLEDPLSNL